MHRLEMHFRSSLISSYTRNSRMIHSVSNSIFEIFENGVKAVQPGIMVKNVLSLSDGNMIIKNKHSFVVNNNVHLIGLGKAAMGMVRNVCNVLGDHIVAGVVSVPEPNEEDLVHFPELFTLPSKDWEQRIRVYHGPRDNIPNKTVLRASEAAADLAKHLDPTDLLLVCITGGGSALFSLPKPGLSLEDLVSTTRVLAAAGASIEQLNAVRSQLDLLKGGGLARLAGSVQVVSLILSDVIGDSLSVIASGPTVTEHYETRSSIAILKDLKVLDTIPPRVLQHLQESDNRSKSRTDSCHPLNIIVGNNRIALEASLKRAESLGFSCLLLSNCIHGDAEVQARRLADLVSLVTQLLVAGRDNIPEDDLATLLSQLGCSTDIVQELFRLSGADRVCLLAGGENPVRLPNNVAQGRGGRCSHMALVAGLHMPPSTPSIRIRLLFGASDGLDGPTDAAGAWLDPVVFREGVDLCGLDAEDALTRCDSYHLFRGLEGSGAGGLLPGRLTGTNVMDVIVVTLEKV